MANDDRFGKRNHEEDYFRKQDRELIERMRKAAANHAGRPPGGKAAVQDPGLLQDIAELGFNADTVSLLPLVPILQVAWADGAISAPERKLILEVARIRGISEASPAGQQLADWLSQRPAPDVFSRADRLVGAMLAAGSDAVHDLTAADLVKYCESIAAASGGILGLGKVSSEERAAIEQIQNALKSR
jgi:hypothetical protein